MSVYPTNTTIAIEASTTAGDGGGGVFVYDPDTSHLACPPDNHGHYQGDGGVTVADAGHNCFRRLFSGPVDLRWYGVADATNPTTCLSNMASCDSIGYAEDAFTASALFGDGGVTTNGRSIAIVARNLKIPAPATICAVSGNTITISQPLMATFSHHQLQFTGCGYPAGQFWLGNCVATALFNSGGDQSDVSQGMSCEYFHSWGFRVDMHMLNGPASRCTNYVLSGGGGAGQNNDPFSAGLWFTGDATKSQFTNGRAEAQLSILNVPSNERDGLEISNTEFSGSVVNGANGNLILAATAEKGTSGKALFTYNDSQSLQLNIVGNSHPDSTFYSDDPSVVTASVYCASNHFAGGTCDHPKGTPTCKSGCGSSMGSPPCAVVISGTDGNFDACTDNSSSSVQVALTGTYTSAPICTVSPNASVAVSVSSVDTQTYGTTVTFSLASPTSMTHLYASCHAPG